MSDDVCFHLKTFCDSLAPASGFPRDFFSRGSHWVAHVRTCACVSLSWYRHTQLVFSSGLAPLAAQRVDGTGTEQQVGRPWGGRWLGLDLLLVKCALAHLAARAQRPSRAQRRRGARWPPLTTSNQLACAPKKAKPSAAARPSAEE